MTHRPPASATGLLSGLFMSYPTRPLWEATEIQGGSMTMTEAKETAEAVRAIIAS